MVAFGHVGDAIDRGDQQVVNAGRVRGGALVHGVEEIFHAMGDGTQRTEAYGTGRALEGVGMAANLEEGLAIGTAAFQLAQAVADGMQDFFGLFAEGGEEVGRHLCVLRFDLGGRSGAGSFGAPRGRWEAGGQSAGVGLGQYRIAARPEEQFDFGFVAGFRLVAQAAERLHDIAQERTIFDGAAGERLQVRGDLREHAIQRGGGCGIPRDLSGGDFFDGLFLEEGDVAERRQPEHGGRSLDAVDEAMGILQQVHALGIRGEGFEALANARKVAFHLIGESGK